MAQGLGSTSVPSHPLPSHRRCWTSTHLSGYLLLIYTDLELEVYQIVKELQGRVIWGSVSHWMLLLQFYVWIHLIPAAHQHSRVQWSERGDLIMVVLVFLLYSLFCLGSCCPWSWAEHWCHHWVSLCLCKELSVASSWRQSGYWGLGYLGLHENPLYHLHTFTCCVLQNIREGMIYTKQMRPLSQEPEGNEVLVKWMRVSGEQAILSELVGVWSAMKGTWREKC